MLAKARGFLPSKKFRYQGIVVWLALLVVLLLVTGGIFSLRHWYFNNLSAVSSSQTSIPFAIDQGTSVQKISTNLEDAGLIRSAKAFQTYVRSKELGTKLQAGTYNLSPSMTVQQIVDKFVKGEVSKNLLTILPGKRLDQIEATFAKAGYSQSDIDSALNPATYAGLPLLTNLPAGASLEGFLYPDSFQKQADTPATDIVNESLTEMQSKLTDDVINGFGAQGLSVYQGITMASIVEKESDSAADQPTIAQVFLSRYHQGMMLGSDVTAFYGAEIAGAQPSVGYDSPYNTRIHTGLPPGPIGNVTDTALKAVAHPAGTNYLYFVAGDDGTVHFSQTEVEHEQQIQQFCTKACSQ